MKIGLDIDDVLFPWSDSVHDACTAAGITNGREITQWGFHEDYGCGREIFWHVVNQAYVGGMLLNVPPYAGVRPILAQIRGAGHTVHLVTARGFEGSLAPMVRDHTLQWVARHIPHDTLTFAKDKTVLRVDHLLDDSVQNVLHFNAAGGSAWLRNQAHNQVVDQAYLAISPEHGGRRVDDLEHFLHHLGLVANRQFRSWAS